MSQEAKLPIDTSTAFTRNGQSVGTEDVQLIARLLVGLLYVGGDELLRRLRAIEHGVAAEVDAYGYTVPEDETMAEMISYLALGALLRGQRRVARRVRRAASLSMQAAGWALGAVDRLTNNPLGRPLRQPVERRMWELFLDGQQAIVDGRREAYASRLIATSAVEELVDDVIDSLVENPQLMGSIQNLLREQSIGLTGTVVGNTRQLTLSADDVAEGLARRLLRRGPRPPLTPLAAAASDVPLQPGQAGDAAPQADSDDS